LAAEGASMNKLLKKRSQKTGLPPGTLMHIGEERKETVKISVLEYDEQTVREEKNLRLEQCFVFKSAPTVTWIHVEGVHDVEVLEKLGNCFELHPLMMEDILTTDQRPKMEDYEKDLFIVLKMLTHKKPSQEIRAEQISLIFRTNVVISFQESPGNCFAPIWERIQNGKTRIRKLGADYLAYALIDFVVDHYFILLETLGERIEALEGRLVANPAARTLQDIQKLKREMIVFRRWIWPLRELLSGLQREESFIQKSTSFYLRDVYDHTIQVMDTIEIFRDMLSGMVDLYMSSINNRMNAVMKVLTIIATIFMPLTFIAGLYGMNFKFMPELEWHFGYPTVLLGMAAIGVSMLIIFRKKGWL
jgi:magnesium transporter